MSNFLDLAKLYFKNAQLIDDLYFNREIDLSEATYAALNELHLARIVVENQGQYRLKPAFRKSLDDHFGRGATYQTSVPIWDQVEAFRREVLDYKEAVQRNDPGAQKRAEEEAIDFLWQIKDDIETDLKNFSIVTRNCYHTAKSLEERMRRYEYYHRRANALVRSLEVLRQLDLLEMLVGPDMRVIMSSFQKNILENLETWSNSLSSVISEMLTYMYKTKEVSDRIKRLRALCHAKKKISKSIKEKALQGFEPVMMALDQKERLNLNMLEAEVTEIIRPSFERLRKRGTLHSVKKERLAPPDILYVKTKPKDPDFDPVSQEVVEYLQDCLSSPAPLSAWDWALARGIKRPQMFLGYLYFHLQKEDFVPDYKISPERTGILPFCLEDIHCTYQDAKMVDFSGFGKTMNFCCEDLHDAS